jgi:hypothetical protein
MAELGPLLARPFVKRFGHLMSNRFDKSCFLNLMNALIAEHELDSASQGPRSCASSHVVWHPRAS